MLVRMWRKRDIPPLLVGLQAGTTILEISLAVPQKTGHSTIRVILGTLKHCLGLLQGLYKRKLTSMNQLRIGYCFYSFLLSFYAIVLHAFSRPARKDATNRNLPRQKLYCLHLQEPESKRAREQEREWRNPVPFKENYPPPRTCHSLIGCSPSAELSSWGRQSTWSGELPLPHAQIICLPLRTQDVSAILQWRM